LERIVAVRREAQRQTARLGRLQSLAQSLAAQMPALAQTISAPLASAPAAPTGDDDAAWTGFLRPLDASVRELETLLGQAGGAFGAQVRATLAAASAAPTIDDVLS